MSLNEKVVIRPEEVAFQMLFFTKRMTNTKQERLTNIKQQSLKIFHIKTSIRTLEMVKCLTV